MMKRSHAFLLHLAISVTVVGSFVLATNFLWYPTPLLTFQGGLLVIGILMAVDVILGPLLTLLVYKPGKKRLVLDLAFIGLIQSAAFTYGAYVVYSERPLYLAFAYSRFYVVRASDMTGLPPPEVDNAPRYGVLGPRIVFAHIPDSELRNGGGILSAIMGDSLYADRAESYRPFPQAMDLLARETIPAKAVIADHGDELADLAIRLQRKPEELYYFLISGRVAGGIAVVTPDRGELVGIVGVGAIRGMLANGVAAK